VRPGRATGAAGPGPTGRAGKDGPKPAHEQAGADEPRLAENAQSETDAN
jgi:hypothetical protein